jgi:hypothetical protein
VVDLACIRVRDKGAGAVLPLLVAQARSLATVGANVARNQCLYPLLTGRLGRNGCRPISAPLIESPVVEGGALVISLMRVPTPEGCVQARRYYPVSVAKAIPR